MSGKTVHSAILLLVIGNLLAIFSDIVIKWHGEAPLFQFVFMRLICAAALLVPLLAFVDRRVLLTGAKLHVLRAHIGMFAFLCMVIALHTLPLATANAVFYAGPVITMLLAVVFFGERATALSLLAVACGFAGILITLQPVELSWQSLSALGAAAALSLNALLVRKLPAQHTPLHTLLLTQVYALPAALVLMLWEGAAWDWSLLLTAFGSALFILGYSLTILLAYRQVAANQVTSAEYTGLIWAVLFGWWWFGEVPDAWFVIGTLLITGPLIALGLRGHRRARAAATAAAQETA